VQASRAARPVTDTGIASAQAMSSASAKRSTIWTRSLGDEVEQTIIRRKGVERGPDGRFRKVE
jgi:hypothetical protein